MRTLYGLINKATIYLTIVSFMALMCGGMSFAQSNGNGERLSENSSKTMSPGWLNADLYKTYRIKEVKKGNEGTQAGKEAEYIEKELGQSLAENTTNKVKLDLKKKTSGGSETTESTSTSEGEFVQTSVEIGGGDSKVSDEDGRIISEIVDGNMITYEYYDSGNLKKRTVHDDATVDSLTFIIYTYHDEDFYGEGRGRLQSEVPVGPPAPYSGRNIGDNKFYKEYWDGTDRVKMWSTISGDSWGGQDFLVYDYYYSGGLKTIVQTMLSGNPDFEHRYGGRGSGISLTVEVLEEHADITPQPTTISTLPSEERQIYRKRRSYYGKIIPDTFLSTISFDVMSKTRSVNGENLKNIFKGLLANKDALLPNKEGVIDPDLLAKLVQDALGEIDLQTMEIATMLADILNNSTAEQKVMIDSLQALIDEAQKLEEETGSEELKKASDEFAEIAATVLLAQAIPDLLKEGDISSIKGMFGDLDSEKSKILLEYHTKANGYYQSIVKELAANIVTLQLKDILSKELTERELEKLPAQHIDEIINKIRNQKDKTITEEQILKVEAKYREEYLAPAKRILEENMKTLLQGFTQRLFSVLNEAGIIKEKMTEEKPVLNADLSLR